MISFYHNQFHYYINCIIMLITLVLYVKHSRVPLAIDNKIVVWHRFYTQTPNSATFQHSIANDSATLQHVLQCYRNLSARSGNIRKPILERSAFFRVAFGLHSATSDRFRRLYCNLSYATLRLHANTCRTGPMATLRHQ